MFLFYTVKLSWNIYPILNQSEFQAVVEPSRLQALVLVSVWMFFFLQTVRGSVSAAVIDLLVFEHTELFIYFLHLNQVAKSKCWKQQVV